MKVVKIFAYLCVITGFILLICACFMGCERQDITPAAPEKQAVFVSMQWDNEDGSSGDNGLTPVYPK